MSIYTKTGDKGTTLLIGGKRVPKYHERIEAYGTIDELMANLAMIYDHTDQKTKKEVLLTIQKKLMSCATILATDCSDCRFKLPQIVNSDIEYLEAHIDKYQKDIPTLKKFIIPGGHVIVSACHIARTVCRRAERLCVLIAEKDSNADIIIKYLNRLSDFLFILSRKLAYELKIEEITWDMNS